MPKTNIRVSITCPVCHMTTDVLKNHCSYCGVFFDSIYDLFVINTKNISRLRSEDQFVSSLSKEEFSFLLSVLRELNKRYMNRLLFECGKSYFGIRHYSDSPHAVRFYFAKKNRLFFYKCRTNKENNKVITIEKLNDEELNNVVSVSLNCLSKMMKADKPIKQKTKSKKVYKTDNNSKERMCGYVIRNTSSNYFSGTHITQQYETSGAKEYDVHGSYVNLEVPDFVLDINKAAHFCDKKSAIKIANKFSPVCGELIVFECMYCPE